MTPPNQALPQSKTPPHCAATNENPKPITKPTLWLIDDDPALRLILEDTFTDAQMTVVSFTQAKAAWTRLNDMLQTNDYGALPNAILTDIRMPLMDGLSFSDWVHKHFADIPIVIMTAHSDLQSAVDSYQTGAFDYLPKPFDLDDAIAIVNKAISTAMQKKQAAEKQTKNNHKQRIQDANNSNPNALIDRQFDDRQVSDKQVDDRQVSDKQVDDKQVAVTSQSAQPSINPPNNTLTIDDKATTNITNKSSGKVANPNGIIGQSAAMQTVFRAIGRLSHSAITVLITGESGTGKELVANALHQHSPRRSKPFIALNMAAIPHDLIESELFGHEKGAFTGATTQRQGRFEQADGGTLFLDEIGDMPFSTQTRLLRVLANAEFYRVGGQKPVKVDVRIIAATHQDLEQLVKQGKFREDLFYRLNVIRLPLPPLRKRREDIAELVGHFMQQAAGEMNTRQKNISASALAIMQAFDWLGNVRQLENVCRWLTVMATGDTVLPEDLPPELTQYDKPNNTSNNTATIANRSFNTNNHASDEQTNKNLEQDISNSRSDNYATTSNDFLSNSPVNTKDTHALWQHALHTWATQTLAQGDTHLLQTAAPAFERMLLSAALEHTGGRKGEAAELLGWGRNTLTRKIKQLGL